MSEWGGSGIGKEVFDFVRRRLAKGSTILELGSGNGSTKHFGEIYKVYSIEQDSAWLNKHKSTYIHAPIVDGWFDKKVLKKKLPKKYDMIFVDAPVGEGNRWGFAHNYKELFKKNVPIIIHDAQRGEERKMALFMQEKFGLELRFFMEDENSDFAVLGRFRRKK